MFKVGPFNVRRAGWVGGSRPASWLLSVGRIVSYAYAVDLDA